MEHQEQFDSAKSSNQSAELTKEIASAKLIEEYFVKHQKELIGCDCSVSKERVQQMEAKAAPGSEDYKILSFVDRHYDDLRKLETTDRGTPRMMYAGALDILQDVDPSKKEAYVKSSNDGYLNNAAVGALAGTYFGTPLAWLGTAGLAAAGVVTAPAWVPLAIGVGAGVALGEFATYQMNKDAGNYYDQKQKAAAKMLADFR